MDRSLTGACRRKHNRRVDESTVCSAAQDSADAKAVAISGYVGSGGRWALVAAWPVEDLDGDGSEAGLELGGGGGGVDADGGDEQGKEGFGLHFEGWKGIRRLVAGEGCVVEMG